MLQKADIGEAAVYRRSVDRSRTFSGSGILFGMPDSILRFVRNRECTKRDGRFVGVVFSGGPDRDRLRQIL